MSLPLIPAATVILLKDTPQGIKTLLLQRNTNAGFLPGFWVFPGGIVEPQDQQASNWQTAACAAAREAKEESGISVNPDALVAFSHWIAPKEAGKRFDTRFFLCHTNATELSLQAEEISNSLWLTPAQAIAEHRQSQLPIIPPTLVSLALLEKFTHCQHALQHYQTRTPLRFAPKVCFWQDQTFMLYEGDAGYSSLDSQLTGARHRCLLADDGWHYQRDNTTGGEYD